MAVTPGVRARRRVLALGIAVVLLVLASGCSAVGTLTAFIDLQKALQDEGYSHVRVNIDQATGGSGLRIDANKPGDRSLEAATTEIARLAWTTFPRRFETLRVKIGGDPSQTLSRADLEQRFGARRAELDRKTLREGTNQIGVGVLVALGVSLLLAVAVALLVLLLVRRSNRRKRARIAALGGPWVGPPGAGPYGPPGGYPPGGYPPAGAYPPAGTPPPGAYPPPGSYPPPAAPDPKQTPPGWG